jgi:hypothetical protein
MRVENSTKKLSLLPPSMCEPGPGKKIATGTYLFYIVLSHVSFPLLSITLVLSIPLIGLCMRNFEERGRHTFVAMTGQQPIAEVLIRGRLLDSEESKDRQDDDPL